MVQPFAQLRPKTVFFFKKAQVGFSILERALSRILKQDRKSKFRHVWALENLVILVFLQKFQFNFAPPSLNLGSSFEKCTIFKFYFVHVPYFSVTILIVRAGQLFLWKNADCEKIVQKLFLPNNDIGYSPMLLCIVKISRLFSFWAKCKFLFIIFLG